MQFRTSNFISGSLAAACLGLAAYGVQAQSISGHYPVGVEGIKGASLPPPGFYARDYNVFYWADRLKDGPPGDFDAFAYINAPRAVWISDYKILGGYYGADVLLPFTYGDIEIPRVGVDDSTFAMGDIFVEPVTLSWHPKQFDLAVGYGFWAPIGDPNNGTRPARLTGKGFWSHMFTAGATWYPTEDKAWAVSLLNRYEIHMENDAMKVTPGDTYSIEWGFSRSLTKTIEAGAIGYYQQQITDDDGPGRNPNTDLHDRVVGVGPEVSAFCPAIKTFFSLRYAYEFAVEDRPEGNLVCLTLTKPF